MGDTALEQVAGCLSLVVTSLIIFVWAVPFGWAWDGVRSAFTGLPHLDYIQCVAVLFVGYSILPSRVSLVKK